MNKLEAIDEISKLRKELDNEEDEYTFESFGQDVMETIDSIEAWNDNLFEISLLPNELKWVRDGLRLLLHRTPKGIIHAHMLATYEQVQSALEAHQRSEKIPQE